MERRDFIKAVAAGAAAFAVTSAGAAEPQVAGLAAQSSKPGEANLAPPCGLYCGICHDDGCHGCGCACGKCPGVAHQRNCVIFQCAKERQVEHCADCPDFTCTKLIEFAHNPVWKTHATCLDNLRRRKAVGTARWLGEQQEYWADGKRLALYKAMRAACERQHQQFKAKGTL